MLLWLGSGGFLLCTGVEGCEMIPLAKRIEDVAIRRRRLSLVESEQFLEEMLLDYSMDERGIELLFSRLPKAPFQYRLTAGDLRDRGYAGVPRGDIVATIVNRWERKDVAKHYCDAVRLTLLLTGSLMGPLRYNDIFPLVVSHLEGQADVAHLILDYLPISDNDTFSFLHVPMPLSVAGSWKVSCYDPSYFPHLCLVRRQALYLQDYAEEWCDSHLQDDFHQMAMLGDLVGYCCEVLESVEDRLWCSASFWQRMRLLKDRWLGSLCGFYRTHISGWRELLTMVILGCTTFFSIMLCVHLQPELGWDFLFYLGQSSINIHFSQVNDWGLGGKRALF